jgi:hypothetical protein
MSTKVGFSVSALWFVRFHAISWILGTEIFYTFLCVCKLTLDVVPSMLLNCKDYGLLRYDAM